MGYREWLLPAALLNAHARLTPYDKWDEDAEDMQEPEAREEPPTSEG